MLNHQVNSNVYVCSLMMGYECMPNALSIWFTVTDGLLDWMMTVCWWKWFNMYQSWRGSTGEVCINKLFPVAPGAYFESVCRWTACEVDGVCLCGQAGRQAGRPLISIPTSQFLERKMAPVNIPSLLITPRKHVHLHACQHKKAHKHTCLSTHTHTLCMITHSHT